MWNGWRTPAAGSFGALTVGRTPASTSGRNTRRQVAESLNTTGIYSTVRHPLYLGNFLMALGVVLFPMTWWLVVIYGLAFWLYYERIMLAEEAFLRSRFGTAFEEWARRTPAFVPRLRGYVAPDLPFSLRNVLRREYNGAFAVVLLLTLLETTRGWESNGRLQLDLPWIWFAGSESWYGPYCEP